MIPDSVQTLTLASGLVTSWREYGATDGEPVIFLNGWPGCSAQAVCLHELAKRLGFRIIAPDRPGFGCSVAQPGRGLLDWPPIVGAIADHLGLGKFSLLGISGGGPYALATAWALGSRVRMLVLCCSAVPTHAPTLRRGLHSAYRSLLRIHDFAPWFLPISLRAMALLGRLPPLSWVRLACKYLLPAPDGETLSDPAIFALFAPSFQGAMQAGGAALYEDGHPYAIAWPFAVEEINVPVQMWHGSYDTHFQLHRARELAARLPNVTFRARPEGHFSIAFRCAEEMLRELQRALWQR